ncbi:MAG: Stf0 family sulfotransferase [bacterium]
MVPSNRADAYLLCATPRSGSTLLCGLLRSTGVAGRPESYFRLPDEQSWVSRWKLARNSAGRIVYRDFVQAAVAEGSTDNGVFGARVMRETMDELVANLRAVHPDVRGTDVKQLTRAFGRTRFLHLWRENALAQAVSWARAEQTHVWHPGDPTPSLRHQPHFDYEQLHGFVQKINDDNAAWQAWFAASDVRPHRVRYEELVADMAGVTRGVLGFLSLALAEDQTISPRDQRQADELNDEWIARYRDMRQRRVMG